jgi:hypothetical protein
MSSANASTQALPEIAPRREVSKLTPTRTQPIPALQLSREPTLSIIVPIHNEKPRIHPFLLAVERAVEGFRPEVIFVDTGDDDIEGYLKKIRTRFPFDIRRVWLGSAEKGLDPAISAVSGFMSAKLEWMCVASVDLSSFPKSFASLLLEGTTESSDLVLGSRRYKDRWVRSFCLKVISFSAKLFLPKYLKGLSDPLTNLFIVRRSSLFLKRMAPEGPRVLPEILKRFPYLEIHELPLQVVNKKRDSFNSNVREDISAALSLARSRENKK